MGTESEPYVYGQNSWAEKQPRTTSGITSAPVTRRPGLDPDALFEGVRAGQRTVIGRAITLLESTRADHRALAQELLLKLLPHTGNAVRLGITGVPGVGKSTFIESFGMYLVGQGHKVAVLAIDPSSVRTHGSILGDKTRMERLSVEPNAYIRPSPAGTTLGGVAKATRETMMLLEAAGYDVILVETVGVGQSEVTVAGMTDCFAFLTLARTGDQLQGIKRGVLEMADIVAVNKADGEYRKDAEKAARSLQAALRMVRPVNAAWRPPVMTLSGLNGEGLEELWEYVLKHKETLEADGSFAANRRRQQVEWMWQMVNDTLLNRLAEDPDVQGVRKDMEDQVRTGELTATLGAQRILAAFDKTDRQTVL